MPFKGDMRLGGPHDNERTLNGTSSDFESVPAYGTFNSWLYDVTYPIVNGGLYVTINSATYPSQFCDVELKNDGLGGTYTDWTTVTDVQNFASPTAITSVSFTTYVTINGNSYSSGSGVTDYTHDGNGGYAENSTYSYTAWGNSVGSPTSSDLSIGLTTNCNGNFSVNAGTSVTSYFHDGYGGYYTSSENSYSSYGTQIYSESCDDGTGSGGTINTYYYSSGTGSYYTA